MRASPEDVVHIGKQDHGSCRPLCRAKKELNFNQEIWQKGYNEERIKDASDYARPKGDGLSGCPLFFPSPFFSVPLSSRIFELCK
jgi:hypothetical protein